MKRFNLSAIVTGLVAVAVVAGSLLVPEPADAGQALLRSLRSWYWRGGTWGGTGAYATYILPPTMGVDKAPPATGYVGATTIAGKAAQKFTIPKGGLRSALVVTWYCKPGTCYAGYIKSGGIYTETQGKGWFAPNNPTGPTVTTTILPAATTTVFPYFRWSAYTPGGSPTPSAVYRPRHNYDQQQRGGSAVMWPGGKRFGGTMRWLYGPDGFWVQSITLETPWLDRAFFPATQWQRTSLDPIDIGELNSVGYGYRVRYTSQGVVPVTSMTPSGSKTITFKVQYIGTDGPWTTGKVRAYQSAGTFITTLTFSGYDNRTPMGVLGTLSMVRPHLRNSYTTRNDGSATEYTWAAARINGMHVYFKGAPEPGAVLMLGAGVATLVGLATVRRRRR